MAKVACSNCSSLRRALRAAREKSATLAETLREVEAEREQLRRQLAEATKMMELQAADIERFRHAYQSVRPNHPERVPREQLQLAFEALVAMLGNECASNDTASASTADDDDPPENAPPGNTNKKKTRHEHGRRPLDECNLVTEEVEIIPDEVRAAGGKGFKQVGEERSSRVAFRPARYVRLLIRRLKFVRIDDVDEGADPAAASSPVLVAPLPDSVWPNVMADPSAIAHVILSKYDDILPLHRQERISARDGFALPRSTQCGWLRQAHQVTYRIVDAMFLDAKAHAFCIATDATGAPIRAPDRCQSWDTFVFLADRDHIVFRYVHQHATSDSIAKLLQGFRGHLLADAAPIYDALFADGSIIEHACWFHCRRYFYRALETDKDRAMGPLALIARLFQIDGACKTMPLAERTETRASRSRPILQMLDHWVDKHRDQVEPRGSLSAAIGYYENQRVALHRFLDDGRISIHNNLAEQQLRNLGQGRHNWTFFANENGLRWYTTFRSLIASCYLHQLNPREYLEEILRLAPHWSVHRMLELAPKFWADTRKKLDDHQRRIILPPWEISAVSESTRASEAAKPELAIAG